MSTAQASGQRLATLLPSPHLGASTVHVSQLQLDQWNKQQLELQHFFRSSAQQQLLQLQLANEKAFKTIEQMLQQQLQMMKDNLDQKITTTTDQILEQKFKAMERGIQPKLKMIVDQISQSKFQTMQRDLERENLKIRQRLQIMEHKLELVMRQPEIDKATIPQEAPRLSERTERPMDITGTNSGRVGFEEIKVIMASIEKQIKQVGETVDSSLFEITTVRKVLGESHQQAATSSAFTPAITTSKNHPSNGNKTAFAAGNYLTLLPARGVRASDLSIQSRNPVTVSDTATDSSLTSLETVSGSSDCDNDGEYRRVRPVKRRISST